MTRQSYAMEQFTKELSAVRPSAKYTFEDTDGFGTHRTVVLDAKTAEWLAPVMRAVQDKRVRLRGNRLLFSPHPIEGESRDPFSLASVVDILYPKKTAKKAAKKKS